MSYELSIKKRLKILIPIFIILSILIYIIESQLYLIGKNKIRVYNVLPFNLKTERSKYINELNSFGFREDNGMSVICKGSRFFASPNMQIDGIIKYGFNDSLLIAKVLDVNSKECFVKILPSESSKFDHETTVCNEISNADLVNLKWVDINPTNDMTTLEIINGWQLLIWVILAPIIFYNFLFIYTKKK